MPSSLKTANKNTHLKRKYETNYIRNGLLGSLLDVQSKILVLEQNHL